ncbi:hypothetical protein DPMN_005203 [Dreissena polymorpha]|uniref:Uncharacterized protein n=1 Tax=Dreissena polymorpha TaxID=45954 RepID=A0A9D4RWC4_DREPO|nr:hypothetical protein DPMN_005203 [Dreissena polymorpha]
MTCIIFILPSIQVSSFTKKYQEVLKLSQDPEKFDGLTDKQTDRLTDRQSAHQKSPPVSPVGDKKNSNSPPVGDRRGAI